MGSCICMKRQESPKGVFNLEGSMDIKVTPEGVSNINNNNSNPNGHWDKKNIRGLHQQQGILSNKTLKSRDSPRSYVYYIILGLITIIYKIDEGRILNL
jgi:hypothetical protein